MLRQAQAALFIAALDALGTLARPSNDQGFAFAQKVDCCFLLSQHLPGKVVIPGTSAFNTSGIEPYWSAQAEDVIPACTVLPSNAEDVSIAIKLLSAAQVGRGDHSCKFAIRSGGHTPIPDAANIAGGVTINLMNLNIVEPAADRSIVSVGPGNRWEDVYRKLDPMNLTVVGGRSRTVGVGGLVLSGGLSFFSPRRGMPSSNVANYEIVLASGEIVNANASSPHADLHKALQGGMNNFGIVTRFDLRALEQGVFWGGVARWNASALPALFSQFEAFASSAGYDEHAQLTLLYLWAAGDDDDRDRDREMALAHMHYTRPFAADAIPPPFRPLAAAAPPASDTFRVAPLTDFTVELESLRSGRTQRLFATATYAATAAMHRAFYALARATATRLLDGDAPVAGLAFIVSAQPFNQVVITKTRESSGGGGSFQGLDAADGDLMIVCLTVEWSDAADDAAVSAAVRALLADAAAAAAERLGAFNEYVFPNYAAAWQDPVRGYGEANAARLRKIARRYDPLRLFQTAVPGGFKL